MQEQSSGLQKQEIMLPKEHSLFLKNRERLTISGVSRVISCDESGAVLETAVGTLSIGGQQIQVSELSVETGCVDLKGQIEFLQYAENRQSSSLLSRLFR